MQDIEFTIRIQSTGKTFTVPKNKSILDVLYENGIDHPSSCKVGMCSKCLVTYTEGTVDHRDLLSNTDIDHDTQLTICSSRASSPLLVIDLDNADEDDEF
jgi:ferredoxin|tara:strand:+ start:339 stop:638 length:300 start_codon:yes stop_codon:yes gene_type:complete